jgi:hypothetical protein
MKYRITAILLALPSYSMATTIVWTDCSAINHQFPYGISESTEFQRIVTDKMAKEFSSRHADKVQEAENLIERNLSIETDGLSEEELKVVAMQMLVDADKLKGVRKSHRFNSFQSARYAFYFEQYKEAADQVIKEKGIKATFIPSFFTACEIDRKLVGEIIERMYNNIKRIGLAE